MKKNIEQAAEIMRKHLAAEIEAKGYAKFLDSMDYSDGMYSVIVSEWVTKASEEIKNIFGEENGELYLGEAIKTIWQECGAWKESAADA